MKPAYTFLYLLLGTCLLWLSSCNDCTTNVSQFQNDDGSWAVYETGDTLLMNDNYNETDTIRVFVNSQVNSQPVPGENFSPGDACIEQYDTRRTSVMQHNGRRFPGLTVVALRRPNDIQVSLVVVNRTELTIPDINTPQHAQRQVGGINYTNVYELTDPDSATTGVSRILFNREFGFLQVDYTSGRTLTRYVESE